MIISHCVMPPGGWQYLQGKINLVGETFDLCVSCIKTHRLHNGLPPGDPVKDLEEYIAGKYPHLRKHKVLA